jgi:hypothetical protein
MRDLNIIILRERDQRTVISQMKGQSESSCGDCGANRVVKRFGNCKRIKRANAMNGFM